MVLDYGELEGSTGYWVECEETGEEGFLAEYDDCFWTYDEEGCYWNNRPAPNRKIRKGKKQRQGQARKERTRKRRQGKQRTTIHEVLQQTEGRRPLGC